jgi:hypothetical protein
MPHDRRVSAEAAYASTTTARRQIADNHSVGSFYLIPGESVNSGEALGGTRLAFVLIKPPALTGGRWGHLRTRPSSTRHTFGALG